MANSNKLHLLLLIFSLLCMTQRIFASRPAEDEETKNEICPVTPLFSTPLVP